MVGQCGVLQLFIILSYRRRDMSGARGIAKYRQYKRNSIEFSFGCNSAFRVASPAMLLPLNLCR